MNDYEGGWAWKRIALFLFILIVLVFSINHLLLQPKPEKPGPTEPELSITKCDPFPDEIFGYLCGGVDWNGIDGYNHLKVCEGYDVGGNCTKQIRILPTEIYLIGYSNLEVTASIEYLSVTFEEEVNAERLFKEKFVFIEPFCLNASESVDIKCVNISFDGAEGFYIEEKRDSKYAKYLLILDGDNLIVVVNECESNDEDLLSLSELKEMVIEFNGIGGAGR